MKYIIVITGASSGFGELTARALAKAGHTDYGSTRETAARNIMKQDNLPSVAVKVLVRVKGQYTEAAY
jgi:NADP-dependent 3-hydroxy acid dehydrogenase YdfG